MSKSNNGLGQRIENVGCGLASAAVFVSIAATLCIRIIRWGLS